MIFRDATEADVRHVCRHLRAEDAAEQFAVRFDDDPEALADDLLRMQALAIKHLALCTDDGEAAVLVGAFIKGPGLAGFHMCSTPRIGEIGREGHRFGKRRFIPAVLVPNVTRAETRILASHSHARRWVRACGFREEGISARLGKNGEDFVQVAWLRD